MEKNNTKITTLDKKYFREIFMLHAESDQKINYDQLQQIFIMVDFKPNEK